jgi:NarL family two-component system sensor histidine kinase YdfH
MHRLYRVFGWPDKATATMAVAFYLFMSVAFAGLAGFVARSVGAALGPVRLSLFSVLLLAHTVLHWFGLRLIWGERKSRGRVAYCGVQAGLIVAISVLTSHQQITIGLWVTLLAETAALLWPEWRPMVLSAVLYLGLMTLSMALLWGFRELAPWIPYTALGIGGLLLYALVLVREGWTRLKAQALVRELKIAQSQLQEYALQLEELTISQERQRMAREMHDTLAQGLAGVILQLEAVDSHLESNRPAEARAVVQKAMQRARQTLHEARRAIQALRSAALEQKDFAAALASEVSQFEATSGVPADFVVKGEPGPISPDVAQDVLRIVQESLSNIGRHAQARHAQVRLVQSGAELQLIVKDDGRGFDARAAMQRPECFGLQGMHERAQRIGASLSIESAPQGGTTVLLSFKDTPEPGREPDQPRLSGLVEGGSAGEELSQ